MSIDYKYVAENRDRIERSLRLRQVEFDVDIIHNLGREQRRLQTEQDAKRAQANTLSAEIGRLKSDPQKSAELKARSSQLKKEIQAGEELFQKIDAEIHEKLLFLPNVLHDSVTEGGGPENNPLIREWGNAESPVEHPLTHDTLGENLGIIDFKRAANVSGARFVFLRGWGARLERALINFMMELHRERGYEEMWPPVLVHRASMTGTGQLPKFEEEAFKTTDPEFFLAPTAEVPVTNFHRGEILPESELPIRYAAFSPCFRREAGSYGKDTKGMIRQHQFDKVELVKFAHPSHSYDEHETLTSDAEEVLRQLELPYRVVSLCGGDIGFSAAKTYDLEVWLPGEGKYREISSCSNFEDFQARRANIRFRPSGGGKPRFVHTLNGSGLAIGRTLVALLENGQRGDGSIAIPKALRPYLSGVEKIGPRRI